MSARPELGRHEPPAVRTRSVLLITAGILVALTAIAWGLELFFAERVGVAIVYRAPFPAPGVTPDEREERAMLERKQRDLLGGAGGRMPIEQAMRAIAAKGAHAFDPIETPR